MYLPESMLYGAWYPKVEREEPNLWILYLLDEKEERIIDVRCFKTKNAATKAMEEIDAIANNYGMIKQNMCLKEAVCHKDAYLFGAIISYTEHIAASDQLPRVEQEVRLRRLVIMTSPGIPEGILSDINKFMAINTTCSVQLSMIEEEDTDE